MHKSQDSAGRTQDRGVGTAECLSSPAEVSSTNQCPCPTHVSVVSTPQSEDAARENSDALGPLFVRNALGVASGLALPVLEGSRLLVFA